MKLICLITLLLLSTENIFSQIKFKVEQRLFKVELTDGSFSDWIPQVKEDQESESTISFDFTINKFLWDTNFIGDLSGSPEEKDMYDILSDSVDNKYADFGFSVVRIECIRKESSLSYIPVNVKLKYELLFFNVRGVKTVYLISKDAGIKIKYLLVEIK